jgi:hypothetical protein
MSTIERISHHTTPDRPSRQRLARRLAGPGWVIMTLACVYIAIIVSRYLTFDAEVYFTEQREAYLQHEFALGVHVLSGVLALLIGPFQFVRRLRRRFVRVHRFIGATYVASATALGVSGLLAPTAYTGLVASAGFTVLDLAMLFSYVLLVWLAGWPIGCRGPAAHPWLSRHGSRPAEAAMDPGSQRNDLATMPGYRHAHSHSAPNLAVTRASEDL